MIVSEITGTENHSEYKNLENTNLDRQLEFLRSIVVTAVNLNRKFLSHTIIKALNYHAISCLHVSAGEYRPCPVTVGGYEPPDYYRVEALMEDFVNFVNMNWNRSDQIYLAAYVLWKLNWIHPFINGNGRTARACCYFVLCVKSNGLLPGQSILPQLLKLHRNKYVSALKHADEMFKNNKSNGEILEPLANIIRDQISVQLASAVENGSEIK